MLIKVNTLTSKTRPNGDLSIAEDKEPRGMHDDTTPNTLESKVVPNAPLCTETPQRQ